MHFVKTGTYEKKEGKRVVTLELNDEMNRKDDEELKFTSNTYRIGRKGHGGAAF